MVHSYHRALFEELKNRLAADVTVDEIELLLGEHDRQCVQTATVLGSAMGLSHQCVDATIGFAMAPKSKQGNQAICGLAGDGAMVFGMLDGTRHVITCGYRNHCPWFMSFLQSPKHVDTFVENERSRREVIRFTIGPDGLASPLSRELVQIERSSGRLSKYWQLEMMPQKDLKFIALLTDGYEQISKIGSESHKRRDVLGSQVIAGTTKFNNVFGDFVSRTCKPFFEDGNAHNFDDFTVCALGIR